MITALIALAAGFAGFMAGLLTIGFCVAASRDSEVEPMSPEDRARVRERLLEIANSPQARSDWIEDYDMECWAESQGPRPGRMN